MMLLLLLLLPGLAQAEVNHTTKCGTAFMERRFLVDSFSGDERAWTTFSLHGSGATGKRHTLVTRRDETTKRLWDGWDGMGGFFFRVVYIWGLDFGTLDRIKRRLIAKRWLEIKGKAGAL
ncbi:hypothetical protein SELMODRAFT_408786 [Selaginella moellendorffii]|uniref:Uncharacterized protein n=1 Tax=Selaginella moellendorffii TaxID=88036 RepID=D8R9Z1_SELML|nr:hypothetical protein SELMODRAFT_408786 [Selaginella moellendorffii]